VLIRQPYIYTNSSITFINTNIITNIVIVNVNLYSAIYNTSMALM